MTHEDVTAGRLRAPIMIGASLLFWGVFATVQAVHIYLSMLSHGHSLLRLIVYEWLVFGFWVAATPLIAAMARRFSLVPWRWSAAAVHTIGALTLTSMHIVWFVTVRTVLRPYDDRTPTDFGPGLLQIYSASFALDVMIYLVILGAIHAFDYHQSSRERAMRAAELERELAEARLAALAAQIQPHFLFNALHTVSGLVRGQEYPAAIKTIAGLSDLLRYALDTSDTQEVKLADEIDATRQYLAIQEIRHRDRLTITLEVAQDTLETHVPRLLLQPLVENAFQHGVASTAAPAWVTVQATRRNGALRIAVANSVGTEARPGLGHGIGLRNTRERLDRLYGTGYTMEARSLDDRYEVVLDLPWRTPDDGATGV